MQESFEMHQVYEGDSRYKISVPIEIRKSSGNPCVKKESSPGLEQKVKMSVRKAIAFIEQKNPFPNPKNGNIISTLLTLAGLDLENCCDIGFANEMVHYFFNILFTAFPKN